MKNGVKLTCIVFSIKLLLFFRAIRESLAEQGIDQPPAPTQPPPPVVGRAMSEEEQMELALRLSSEESQNVARHVQDEEEDEELQRILKLSMEDK